MTLTDPDFGSGIRVLHARCLELEEREERQTREIAELRLKCHTLQHWVNIMEPVVRLYVQAFKDDEMVTLPERLRLQEVEGLLTEMGE